jgi:hypothetical protein
MQEEVSMIRGPPLYLPLTEAQTNRRSEKGERRMAKKTSNLKIVEQQTKAEWQAKYEREKVAKELKEEEESWRLTRPEITARVRALRAELDSFRAQLEGMPFDVVTSDIPVSVDYGDRPYPSELTEAFDPAIKGHYDRLEKATAHDLQDDLGALRWETAETSFQIGVLAGAMFSGASDREIDRLERGLTPLFRAAGVARIGGEP